LRTLGLSNRCISSHHDRRLLVGGSCYRVSDCSMPVRPVILPPRSTVNADTTTNNAERVRADLKNIILNISWFVWLSEV